MENNNFISRFLNGFNFLGRYNRNTDRYGLPINVLQDNYTDYFNSFMNHSINVTANGSEAEVYKTTSDVGLVISRKSDLFSNGRFKMYDYKTDEEIDIKINSQVKDIIKLLERPNPLQTGAEFLKQCEATYNLFGNLFIYQNFAFKGALVPKSMICLPPHLMRVDPTGKFIDQIEIEGIIRRYELELADGKKRYFEPYEIIHIKNFNPENPFVGLSKLSQLGIDISNSRASKVYLNAVSSKMGALGMLVPEASTNQYGNIVPIPELEKIEIEKQFSEITHGIFDGQSKIRIGSYPVKWITFSSAIKDNQILDQLDDNKRTIIDMFGLNENLFSKKSGAKYDNLLEGEKQAYTTAIIPDAELLTDSIMKSWLYFKENDQYLKLDYSHVEALQTDAKNQAEVLNKNADSLKKLVDCGYSKEEALEMLKAGII